MAKIFIISFLMSALTGTGVYLMLKNDNKKIGVVDAVRLFDQYNMKKELEDKAKVKLQMLGKQMDSVENLLNMAKAVKNDDGIKKMSYAYSYVRSYVENEYKQSNKEINEQVWKRLNSAIDAYGKSKGLHLIIGANGMGSVLFNDDYYDLTSEAIKYVNKKYEEGN
ncbi:hypothetical protein CJD36_004465 [Flavipsychrobacter stenotrophus]|uniref:OmpH family outer membrane protein n=1 Tax=Flavipsychrobacter stenotrophus TaxID=2077091 RepID=A0A2S7T1B4_9BACT|nr:OmpH family outer membrane protein [Flavipsychrobacter stenotrophus]PQJ13003.1 hypothetical protein CJD36_004465 [Flavipsychrobacter stenotrophus]